VDAHGFHAPDPNGRALLPSAHMQQAELSRLAAELGLDAVGAAPAGPYEETERHIRERRARGLFARMRFTMAQPEVSCHPESLLPGARSVVSAALSYYAPGPEPKPGEGRLPRYTWSNRYAELREKLEQLGARLGGSYRVLVDENQHVDREGAARAGVGFYGKNTLLITRRHGSWVVLGTVVTTAEIERSAPLDLDCGACTRCIDACPTGALDDPGVLDSTKCLSYWSQAPGAVPAEYRTEMGAYVYGCDICQDVCPWNRGTERRRLGSTLPEGAEPVVSLVEWLEAEDDDLRRRYDRLYFPRNDPRYLRRNALIAAGNSGEAALAPAVEPWSESDDELLKEHALWALERLR
jgi:epoxyqueuosine reductase